MKATAGIAGIGFVVMFLPSGIGALLPIVNESTDVDRRLGVAVARATSSSDLAGWVVSMAILVIAAKLVFDRQEF